jgi:indolepyruvate ferredoxin oxidoreductase
MRAIELNGVFTKQNKEAFAGGRLAVGDVDFMTSLLGREAPKETLDEIVDRRKKFLEAYQNGDYARRYTDLVDRVRRVEGDRLPGSEAVTTAVAKSLFKLMAYKDEYEVARLHMETGFLDRLRQEFEGNFTVKYHLAPPILSAGKDARGRPLKRQFGQWIEPVFRVLARFKFLRGTAFDVFGYSKERRMERGLIDWYEALVAELLPDLDGNTAEASARIASLPMEIRGYGPVKEAAVENVKARIASVKRGHQVLDSIH